MTDDELNAIEARVYDIQDEDESVYELCDIYGVCE